MIARPRELAKDLEALMGELDARVSAFLLETLHSSLDIGRADLHRLAL
jgi:hypothetical protein